MKKPWKQTLWQYLYLVVVKVPSWLLLASLLPFSQLWELKEHDLMRIIGQM